MGNDYWREKHYREHWTKPIDISLLYQLQMIAEDMKKRALNREDKDLAQWASQIRLIVANVNGEFVNIELGKHDMRAPEKQDSSPMPNLRLLQYAKNTA